MDTENYNTFTIDEFEDYEYTMQQLEKASNQQRFLDYIDLIVSITATSDLVKVEINKRFDKCLVLLGTEK